MVAVAPLQRQFGNHIGGHHGFISPDLGSIPLGSTNFWNSLLPHPSEQYQFDPYGIV
jgi:hypothetical protein